MYRNPNPACTKTLKWRQPNKRNVSGSSITIHFHSRRDKKTYLKAQKMFERRDSLHERVLEWTVSHAKANTCVFPTSFAVILWAVALPIVLKVEFNFELICTLPIFFLSPGNCSKSAICHIQNSLENTPIALFSSRLRDGKSIHKKCLRAPFTLIFHSEAT